MIDENIAVARGRRPQVIPGHTLVSTHNCPGKYDVSVPKYLRTQNHLQYLVQVRMGTYLLLRLTASRGVSYNTVL